MSFAEKYLDGERLYKLYWGEWGGSVQIGGAGSYGKLVRWCKENGMTNPATGKVDRMGIWKSVYRWAVNNQEEAYKLAKDAYFNKGRDLTRERWNEEMKIKVNTSYQSKNFTKRWTKQQTTN